MGSAKPKTHFLSTSLYFSAHMYFERSLIHMFLIYLHASHQNAVLYELFDVQEACWAFPLRFPRPHPQGSGSYDLQKRKEKKKKLIRTPNIFSSKVQIVFKRWMASSLSLILQLAVCICLLLTDTTLLDVSNVFLVDIKVHICSVWPRTDPKKRRWALQRGSECILHGGIYLTEWGRWGSPNIQREESSYHLSRRVLRNVSTIFLYH